MKLGRFDVSIRPHRVFMLTPALVAMAAFVGATFAGENASADTVAGSQGTDTSLPLTDSVETVHGRGTFAGLAITVNQTKNLTDQAVSITWTGGDPTHIGPARFGSNFLQVYQCWGDDDGAVPSNPGPPPEQCEQGASGGPESAYPGGFTSSRIISRPTWANYDPAVGVLQNGNVWLPFRAVNGDVVPVQLNTQFNPAAGTGNYWLNPFFNTNTTNELAAASTDSGGNGAELFQTETALESSGLGCGQKSQPQVDGTFKEPKCWLVVVPRGVPADENVGTPWEASADQNGVVTSPLTPTTWANRIAIPLEFNSIDSPCALGQDERRISGNALAVPAVSSWQPVMCANGAHPPYSYATVADATARQQLVSGQSGGPGMAVVSKPYDPSTLSPDNPVLYAPFTLSGIAIGFNIERHPKFDAPSDAQAISGIRIADLNLTPRLVAKLLTQSYQSAVTIQQAPDYPWMAHNPLQVAADPDFLRFNPEFSQLDLFESRSISGLILPSGNSDAAEQVWQWILDDPEALAWLGGQPDEWGMQVNPVYATNSTINPNGYGFGSPLPTSFPKSEPYCYQAPSRLDGTVIPPPLCGTDWMPYVRNYAEAARKTRVANDGAKIAENPYPFSSSDVWKASAPQYLGSRAILSLTDTPSASQYGVQSAHLSRAGDDGQAREFVAPDASGLTKGAQAMTESADVPGVRLPNPASEIEGGYPLTVLTYGAVAPLSLDSAARADYAALISYAATLGQTAGVGVGQLPRGYAPLPDDLKAQAALVANAVLTLQPVQPSPETTTTTNPDVTTTAVATTTVVSVPTDGAAGDPPAAIPVQQSTSASPTYRPSASTNRTPSSTSGPDTIPSTPLSLPADAVPIETPAADTTVPPTTALDESVDEPAATPPSLVSPLTNLAKNRFTVPGLGIVSVGSAVFALEITKRPRKALAAPGAAVAAAGGGDL